MAHKKPVTMVTFREGNEWLDDKDERDFFFNFFFYHVPSGIFVFSVDVHILLILKNEAIWFFFLKA